MIPCDICQRFGHPWYACPDRGKKPVGWKPERLRKGRPAARGSSSKPVIVREVGAPDSNKSTAPRSDVGANTTEASGHGKRLDPVARTTLPAGESLPVDTQPAASKAPAKATLQQAENAAAHLAPTSKGGRPRIHKDRNAYRAKKAKEYRERDRAAKAQQEGK